MGGQYLCTYMQFVKWFFWQKSNREQSYYFMLHIKGQTLSVWRSHKTKHPYICPFLYLASFVHVAPNLNHKTKYLDRDLCWIWPKAERMREALVSLRSHGRGAIQLTIPCNTSHVQYSSHTLPHQVHAAPRLVHATTLLHTYTVRCVDVTPLPFPSTPEYFFWKKHFFG